MDINALIRADIERRNWEKIHVVADRREPFMLGDARRRQRGNRQITVRSECVA